MDNVNDMSLSPSMNFHIFRTVCQSPTICRPKTCRGAAQLHFRAEKGLPSSFFAVGSFRPTVEDVNSWNLRSTRCKPTVVLVVRLKYNDKVILGALLLVPSSATMLALLIHPTCQITSGITIPHRWSDAKRPVRRRTTTTVKCSWSTAPTPVSITWRRRCWSQQRSTMRIHYRALPT